MMRRVEARFPAVFHCNGLGDRLMALPALRALCALYPDRLTIIGMPGDSLTFYADLPIRRVVEIESQLTSDGRTFDSAQVLSELGNCDLLVSFNTWQNAASRELSASLGDIEQVGFFPSFRRALRIHQQNHAIDDYFNLVRLLAPELQLSSYDGPPSLPAGAIEKARQLRDSLPNRVKLLAIHNESTAEKRWPSTNLTLLLSHFLARHEDYLILVVDYGDPGLGRLQQHPRALVATGLDLDVAMALVSVTDCFVGIDSVMLHVADFFRIPGVGLFGPTSWRRWGFRFAEHRHAVADGDMTHLDPMTVLEALESITP